MSDVLTITHPDTGKTFKLGRTRPLAMGPHLSLGNYLLRKFPAAPAATDYSLKPLTFLENVLGNDVSGCCTCAAAFHIGGVLLSNSDQAIPFSTSDVQSLYKKLSGWNGIEDDPSDTGLSEQQVFNYWMKFGLMPSSAPNPHQITGYVAVDGSDNGEVKSALWLFENVYFALNLPTAWINPMPSANGFLWDVAGMADPDAGHAFCGVGYNADGVIVDTWGMLGLMTWAAIAKYGSVYAVLGQDAINRGSMLAPNGFNWTQLVSDFQSMGAVEQ